MSTMALVEGPDGVIAGWETEGQVYFANVKPGTSDIGEPKSAPGSGGARKHPVVAVNSLGETILVWTEDTGWQKGGALAWQAFDKSGKPTRDTGRVERGIPVWGLPTVVTVDGGFTIFH